MPPCNMVKYRLSSNTLISTEQRGGVRNTYTYGEKSCEVPLPNSLCNHWNGNRLCHFSNEFVMTWHSRSFLLVPGHTHKTTPTSHSSKATPSDSSHPPAVHSHGADSCALDHFGQSQRVLSRGKDTDLACDRPTQIADEVGQNGMYLIRTLQQGCPHTSLKGRSQLKN